MILINSKWKKKQVSGTGVYFIQTTELLLKVHFEL